MKRLLIGLMCVAGLANANASIKFKVCNYTLVDSIFSINNADNIDIDGVDYTQYTGNTLTLAAQKISAEHCADIPTISTIDGDNPPYMRVVLATGKPSSLLNPQGNIFALNMMDIQDNFAILQSVTFSPNYILQYVVYIHAIYEGKVGYYNVNYLQNNTDYRNSNFPAGITPNIEQYKPLNNGYSYELYLCDTSQLNPCNGNDELNKLVRNM